MREELLAGGGFLAALGASTCCVVPLTLGAVGVGGTLLSTLTALAPYQTAFRLLAIVLLGAGFWLIYARRSPAPDATACPTVPSRPVTKGLLWAGAIVMAAVLTSGWWERLIA